MDVKPTPFKVLKESNVMRLDEITILLIEDNQGDAGLIQEIPVDCGSAKLARTLCYVL